MQKVESLDGNISSLWKGKKQTENENRSLEKRHLTTQLCLTTELKQVQAQKVTAKQTAGETLGAWYAKIFDIGDEIRKC